MIKVSACLVTRGNVPMQPIIDTLGWCDEILVWDNRVEIDLKVFGRYECVKRASNSVIYWQDDDVIFTEHEKLLAAYDPDYHTANNAHGPNTGGYDDLALSAAGALINRALIQPAWEEWFDHYPSLTNDGMLYEADFIFGILTPFKQIDLPYTRLYVDDDTRLCRQPWQEELKLKYTNMAREIRDGTTTG